ncbi:MAG: DUF401 family protein [Oscillospiraceae bacterium]|nr:DUF401 family protein [Oscillospiraceae bacterium]
MLRQFLAIGVAFALMPFWTKKKLGFGPMLIITGLLLSLIAGVAPVDIINNFISVFTTPSTLKTIIIVVIVGMLGALMKHYGILDKIVDSLKELISSQKTIITVLPAVIGLLSVPGGAALSIPFVDKIGDDMGMSGEVRSVINLSFRHISMFLLPTSTSIIMVTTIFPDVNFYGLIAMNLGFVLLMQFTSYMLYLRKYPDVKSDKTSDNKMASFKNLMIYLSPIYMVVVFNGIFGIEMYISAILSLMIILLLWGLKDVKDYAVTAYKGISTSTFTMLVGVYFVQNTIQSLDQVMNGFVTLFNNASGFSILIVIACAAVLFGLTTGLSMVPLGIILPLVNNLPLTSEVKLVYCFFIYIWSFIGYFFSPLHMCQLLTVKHVGCGNGPVYKEYSKLIPCLAVYSFVLFYLYMFIVA